LQKSTSGAWSRSRGHGSSPLARTLRRACAEGEAASEAGSRWRKPRAREQRYRWRAPRDPTRTARKRGTRSGEGALGDGRRPGPAQAAVFDETTGEAGLMTRGDGDAATLARAGSHPQRVTTEDVRSYVASSGCGRKHRSREVQREGAVDRGSARIAVHLSRGRPGLRLPDAASQSPLDDKASRVIIVATLKLEARRQARLHLVGSSGKRMAGFPDPAAARLRPRMSQRSRLA